MNKNSKNTKLYIICVILFIIAVVLLTFGIKDIIDVSKQVEPKMSDPDWFDKNVEYNKMKIVGITKLSFGVFFSILTVFSFFMINIKKKTSYVFNIARESIQNSFETHKMVKCEYCGAKFVGDTCPGCGARR